MKTNRIFLFLLTATTLAVAGSCGKLSEGVVRDIAFPEHDPQIAVTFMARPDADTLVARAMSSAAILDTAGSQKIKDAVFTLTHSNGTSITWGDQADWVNGLGHVLTDAELAAGTWRLDVEAPGFEAVTAEQVMPPVIDSVGDYAYSWVSELVDSYEGEDPVEGAYLSRTIDFTLTLPDRLGEADYFIVRSQIKPEWEELDEGEYSGGYAILTSQIDDDPRMTFNQTAGGFLFQDIGDLEALTSLAFRVFQELWGPDLDALIEVPVVIEVAAVSPEMALYYERLDLINNPSGGPLFTEPILAFSNVSSGYGCFGLYTSSELELSVD